MSSRFEIDERNGSNYSETDHTQCTADGNDTIAIVALVCQITEHLIEYNITNTTYEKHNSYCRRCQTT